MNELVYEWMDKKYNQKLRKTEEKRGSLSETLRDQFNTVNYYTKESTLLGHIVLVFRPRISPSCLMTLTFNFSFPQQRGLFKGGGGFMGNALTPPPP